MNDAGVSETPLQEGRCRDFRLVEHAGRWYAVHPSIARTDEIEPETLLRHPAVPSALTITALVEVVESFDPAPYVPDRIGQVGEYSLVRHRGRVYGIPAHLGEIDLNLEEERARDGIISGETREEVENVIRAEESATAVEFLGWLPAFKRFGNCGAHPQFCHTRTPPPGYRFTRSGHAAKPTDPDTRRKKSGVLALAARLVGLFGAVARSAWAFAANVREFGLVRCLATLAFFARQFVILTRQTGRVVPTLRFLHSRHFRSQIMAPPQADLVFLTSIPFTYGQNPWVIEIEDATTLFFPYLTNGRTVGVDVARSPYYPVVKAMLESDQCRGIITHVKSTAESLPVLFRSDVIGKKITYAPFGVKLPREAPRQAPTDTIDLLFTNSWHQQSVGFFLRGGLDVLEAFDILHDRYPHLRLTIRSGIPPLADRYRSIIERRWVRVIDRFVPEADLEDLFHGSQIYLLPAARIHVVSLLQAMSYGKAVVVSDGWGMEEYVEHERNGLVVPGRNGRVTWMDDRTGMLREDYRRMHAPDRRVVKGLVEAVSRLVEDATLTRRLGAAARRDVESKYSLDQWNSALKSAFDKARG